MPQLCIIFGDQLTETLAALSHVRTGIDTVLMMEVAHEATSVGHHKQKIALIFSAMRHFAEALRAAGHRVRYVQLTDQDNTGSFTGELARALASDQYDGVILTEPSEWRVLEMVRGWETAFGIPVRVFDDNRFFASTADFARWANGRTTLTMEFFYRPLRQRTGLLMDGAKPAGGAWNFDADNRKSLPKSLHPRPRPHLPRDAMTQDVLALVQHHFAGHFGTLDDFNWPVTRAQALACLDDFILYDLPLFGDYQDAMRSGEPFVFHSLLSPALNTGLLTPLEVCRAAELAWQRGMVPLNAAEGFIRQILGWREYVRGLYWHVMPDYPAGNFLDAKRPIPDFYWTGDTDMHCMANAIGDTIRHAYSHHIQRLMITGNFALLAGILPADVEEWYLAVYADAFDWVELPNTHGMALFADGGIMGTKPYAASGAYINRMSDFCKDCRYDVKEKIGPDACPFNYLYWDFLIRNEDKLSRNPRMTMPYRTLAGWDEKKKNEYSEAAGAFLDRLPAYKR